MQGAFRHKRVVHAGLKGRMIPPDKAQARWNALMERPVEGNPLQMAYLHIPFCKTKCLYCGFFQNGTDMSVEDRYVDHLLMELAQDADKPSFKVRPSSPSSLAAAHRQVYLPPTSGVYCALSVRPCPLPTTMNLPSKGASMTLWKKKWMSG